MAVTRKAVARQSDTGIRLLDEDELRLILRAHPKISSHISEAPFAHVSQRKITLEQYHDLTTQVCQGGDSDSWRARIDARRSRLASYVGRSLVCIFIRFPTAHFTVEIDPKSSAVVHFEGQAT